MVKSDASEPLALRSLGAQDQNPESESLVVGAIWPLHRGCSGEGPWTTALESLGSHLGSTAELCVLTGAQEIPVCRCERELLRILGCLNWSPASTCLS